MQGFRADLHIHTVLSPCASLDMSPKNIIAAAHEKGLALIGVTDHNSTKNCRIVRKLGEDCGIAVLCGVEINTKEEVHCLAFFENDKTLDCFQDFLDRNLPGIPNNTGRFGYQLVVDENDNILESEDRLLISALNAGIEDVEAEVHGLGGIFIPAHINKTYNSIYSQLGLIPQGLKFEALEISRNVSENEIRKTFSLGSGITLIRNSDAHLPEDIGSGCSLFTVSELVFDELKLAFAGKNNRSVKT